MEENNNARLPAILVESLARQQKQIQQQEHAAILQQERRVASKNDSYRVSLRPVKVIGKRRLRRIENVRTLTEGNVESVPFDESIVPPPTQKFPSWPAASEILEAAAESSSAVSKMSESSMNANTGLDGKFNRSIKGIKKTMKRVLGDGPGRGGVVEQTIALIDEEIRAWLDNVHVVVPNQAPSSHVISPKNIVNGHITEIQRSPYNLTWKIQESFSRLLVHCVARYYHVASFSKTDINSQRITFLLRPISRNPINTSIITPPTTDMSSGNEMSTSSQDEDDNEDNEDNDKGENEQVLVEPDNKSLQSVLEEDEDEDDEGKEEELGGEGVLVSPAESVISDFSSLSLNESRSNSVTPTPLPKTHDRSETQTPRQTPLSRPSPPPPSLPYPSNRRSVQQRRRQAPQQRTTPRKDRKDQHLESSWILPKRNFLEFVWY